MTTERIGETSVFQRMTPAERVLIRRASRPVVFEAGQRVFSEGNPARGCWLLATGRVALDTVVPGVGSVIVHTLGPGDILGWSWLVPPYTWHFGATAITRTTATSFDTVQLRALAEQDPKFGQSLTMTLFEALLQRMQSTRARLLDLYRSDDVSD